MKIINSAQRHIEYIKEYAKNYFKKCLKEHIGTNKEEVFITKKVYFPEPLNYIYFDFIIEDEDVQKTDK